MACLVTGSWLKDWYQIHVSTCEAGLSSIRKWLVPLMTSYTIVLVVMSYQGGHFSSVQDSQLNKTVNKTSEGDEHI